MEVYEIILIIVAILIAILIIGILSARATKTKQYYKLMASYGQLQKKEYSYEEYESISHFYKNTKKDEQFGIDDITWNDLEMDRIFLMINNTHSSVGRDYLYKILRTPVSDKSILDERERLIQYFDSHQVERTKLMQAFSRIGFTKKISISDYMDNLFRLKPESNMFHYMTILLMVGSIIYTLFVNPVMGIAMILFSFGFSIVSYYKIKNKINSYFECIKKLCTMVKAAKVIKSMHIEELSEYNDYFDEVIKKFGKITRNSFILESAKTESGSIGDVFLEYYKIFTHVDLIKFNTMLRKFGKNYNEVLELMNTLGLLEAMISIGSFRKLLPYMCIPEFTNDDRLSLLEVYHLAIKTPVPNSINEDRPVLITGSNASGKSTFLKSVAINAILAQTINTCPAKSYKAPFYRIYSSMALNDDIESGESYYIVEIKSLKRILDATKTEGAKILCFIDEVLRGTNTVERISASSEILKNFADNNVMCFAATHDIELTHILEKHFANYHFDESVEDDEIVFNYEIHNGRATSRNAIKLLGIIGYDKEIIDRSENRANDFINTGIWREC